MANPRFTAKTYNAVAAILRECLETEPDVMSAVEVARISRSFSKVFAADNPRFDESLFEDAIFCVGAKADRP